MGNSPTEMFLHSLLWRENQKVEFEDIRYKYEDFPAMKSSGKFPFNQLPILEIDDQILSQSNAILLYVGKLGKLYGRTLITAVFLS